MRLSGSLACFFLALSVSPAALAGSGVFVTEESVDAVEQPESAKVVFSVQPGVSYPLMKKGGPDRVWCKLQGPKAEGWVLCDGTPTDAVQKAPGTDALVRADHENTRQQQASRGGGSSLAEAAKSLGGGSGAGALGTESDDGEAGAVEVRAPASRAAAPGEAAACASTCEQAPLFAKAPALSALDREVLDLCPARPDASVSAGDVQRFFAKHYDDARVQRALSAAGRPGSRQANIEWLTSLWVSTGPRNAFTHVFCGDDWQRGPIGGLHFLPRYAQLEAEGKVCYQGPVKGEEAVRGEQYLIRFKGLSPWSCGVKRMGGFPTSQDAVSIAAIGTRAFARCCARGGAKKEGGVYSAPDVEGGNWRIWCGTRNGTYGIATLHPTDEAATCSE
ncbi:EndoU domain-containing protein [Corallococcus carmarthensis]|uniref:EndoU domain-containing protein n=1 Tax=Corallococcus carmarthensis TaxID=2316728 RepID=UPI00148C644D|nr:EndoU domain-containing protein [Corallococcus carmarthensis]NOK18032.1 EndoU domain-containing protein [Corallococcus carmarthensis]